MKDFKKGGRFGAKPARDFSKPFAKRGERGDFSRPTELHSATCAHCGKACEVPFRPNGKKPVFCKDCFVSDKADAPRAPYRPAGVAPRGDDLKSQVEMLSSKVDKLIRMVEALKK